MSLTNFDSFALTRAEMKNIKGGDIYCGCYYEGVGYVYGLCSGPDVNACNSYPCSGGGQNGGCFD